MDKAAMQKAVRKIYPDANLVSATQFRQGLMNRTYDVRIERPRRHLILRFYPKDHWKPAKEHYLYTLVRKNSRIPVPDVLAVGRNYLILSKIDGHPLRLGNNLGNKKLVFEAGKVLARLHQIKFPSFGWIIGKKVEPSFLSWAEFLRFDTCHKLEKLPRGRDNREMGNRILAMLQKNKSLLGIRNTPSLLHKDFHQSHILVGGGKINGIIDFEWAIAGHNELDLAKSCLWMFKGDKAMEAVFLDGYTKVGRISKEFNERRKLYEVLVLLSSIALSHECGNKEWCADNSLALKKALLC